MNHRIAAVATFTLAFAGAAFAQSTQEAPATQVDPATQEAPATQVAAPTPEAPATEIAGPPQATMVTTGDTLLIERVQLENKAAMPARGMSMQEVEARYGAPADKLAPRGGQKQQWPTINRWTYPTFTVYFEKNRVIDAVANKVANEVGPKPAIR
jgi:hypothetical protein